MMDSSEASPSWKPYWARARGGLSPTSAIANLDGSQVSGSSSKRSRSRYWWCLKACLVTNAPCDRIPELERYLCWQHLAETQMQTTSALNSASAIWYRAACKPEICNSFIEEQGGSKPQLSRDTRLYQKLNAALSGSV